jgi:hypothetical protein
MADVIGSLWVTLGLDAANLEKGMGKAQGSLTKWRDDTNKNTSETAKWGTAIAAQAAPFIAVGYAVNKASQAASEYGDEIADLKISTTLSENSLQRLRYTVNATGGEFSGFTTGISFFAKNIQNATDETSAQAEALRTLGIDAIDPATGKIEDMNTLLPKVIDKLHNMDDKTQALTLTSQLFGKNSLEVSKMVELGADGIKAYGDRAEKLGMIMSPEELKNQQKFKEQWAEMNTQLEMMYLKLGTELIPVMQDLVPVVIELMPVIQGLVKIVGFLVDGIDHTIDRFRILYEVAQGVADLGTLNFEGADEHGGNVLNLMGARPMASGGIVTKPTFAMIGEAGPEAVVPLSGSGGIGGVTFKDCTFNGVTRETVKGLAQELNTYVSQKNRGRGTGA